MHFFSSLAFVRTAWLLIPCLVCALPARPKLTVAVAANVQYAFDDLRTAFTKQTGIAIKPIFGSSGKLTAQIQNRAPFDVFVSADMEYPEALHRAGLATSAPQVYAYGVLVLWSSRTSIFPKGWRCWRTALSVRWPCPIPRSRRMDGRRCERYSQRD